MALSTIFQLYRGS